MTLNVVMCTQDLQCVLFSRKRNKTVFYHSDLVSTTRLNKHSTIVFFIINTGSRLPNLDGHFSARV